MGRSRRDLGSDPHAGDRCGRSLHSQRPLTNVSLLFPNRGTLAKKALQERREGRWVPAAPLPCSHLPPWAPPDLGPLPCSHPSREDPLRGPLPRGAGRYPRVSSFRPGLRHPSALLAARGQCAGGRPTFRLVLEGPRVTQSEPMSSTQDGPNTLSRLASGSTWPPGSNRLPRSSRSQGERLSLGFSWRSGSGLWGTAGPVLGILCFNLPPAHAGGSPGLGDWLPACEPKRVMEGPRGPGEAPTEQGTPPVSGAARAARWWPSPGLGAPFALAP